MASSRSLRPHREILASALKAANISHAKAGKAMGLSAAAVGHKLTGIRPWAEGELERMCELVGYTLVRLMAESSDLVPVQHREAMEGASILDALPPERRQAYLAMLRSEAGVKPSD